MANLREIYKCVICGNIVEVLHAGPGTLVCCGQPMQLQKEQTQDSTKEKHVPYVEQTKTGLLVKVGQNEAHPMIDKHYIEWIQVIADGISYRQFLKPGDKPQAEFSIKPKTVEAREYCNIHGLWKN